METSEIISIILLLGILILLAWNIYEFRCFKGIKEKDSQYFELKAKLNFITATGTLFILVISYLGLNVKDEIVKKSEPLIYEMIKTQKQKIDSLLDSKNILKAGIYIVSDIVFKEDSIYKFENLKTIDNSNLPIFTDIPKLIINTNTGENLRLKEVTKTYFIIEKPRSPYVGLMIRKNPNFKPMNLKIDLWIADYKTK